MMRLNRKGFTLVEVLIVVAILGLLAAIAIPNLMKARVGTDLTACLGNQRSIEGAITTWIVKDDVDPSGILDAVGEAVTAGYLRSASDARCPSPGRAAYSVSVDSDGHVTATCTAHAKP